MTRMHIYSYIHTSFDSSVPDGAPPLLVSSRDIVTVVHVLCFVSVFRSLR